MNDTRPRVFIGSSTEGLHIAETLQVNLDYGHEVSLWSQGVFEPASYTLSALVRAAQSADFAILVVSPDDQTLSRGVTKDTARDNVIFELGLLMGVLGAERTFMVHDRAKPPALPSDLLGITPATYAQHSDGNWEAALGAPTTKIKQTIKRLGRRTTPATTSPAPQSSSLSGIDPMELNRALERLGNFLVQALWTAPRERGDRVWEQIDKIGAPPAVTDPIKKTLKYEADVKASLDSIMSEFLSSCTLYADSGRNGVATEFTIETAAGRVFIDLAPVLFAGNGVDTIEVTMTTRVSMLKNDPEFIGQVLIARDVDTPTLNEVQERIMLDQDHVLDDVRIVHYRSRDDVGLLLHAIQELLVKAPARPTSAFHTSASEDSDYISSMLGVLVNEVLNGPTGRYLRLGDKSKTAKFKVQADLVLERSADGMSVVVSICSGLYSNISHGISTLRQYLDELFHAPGLADDIGGLLIVTQAVPRPGAIDAFVGQITESLAPVPVVLADVTGLEQSQRLIEALRQVSYLPGQDYE